MVASQSSAGSSAARIEVHRQSILHCDAASDFELGCQIVSRELNERTRLSDQVFGLQRFFDDLCVALCEHYLAITRP